MFNYTECITFSWPSYDFSVEIWFNFQNYKIYSFKTYTHIGLYSDIVIEIWWKKNEHMYTWSHIILTNNISNWIHKIVYVLQCNSQVHWHFSFVLMIRLGNILFSNLTFVTQKVTQTPRYMQMDEIVIYLKGDRKI